MNTLTAKLACASAVIMVIGVLAMEVWEWVM
jgi:hypothetical protein